MGGNNFSKMQKPDVVRLEVCMSGTVGNSTDINAIEDRAERTKLKLKKAAKDSGKRFRDTMKELQELFQSFQSTQDDFIKTKQEIKDLRCTIENLRFTLDQQGLE